MFGLNQKFATALLIPTLLATACAGKEQNLDEGSVNFTVNVLSDDDVRSQITASDNMITSLELYIFDIKSGGLARRVTFSEGEELTAEHLARGREYIVYALANCTCRNNPKRISDMEDVSISPGSLEQISKNGLPMAGISQKFSHESDRTTVDISLERLVSKVFLTMDLSKLKGTFTIKDAALHNTVATISAFAEGSSEETSADGDRATDVDLTRLNGGNSIALIAGENLQGTLLEGNTDPWQKTPENIAGKKDLCTYLSVKGDYYRDGLSIADLCYNMYLGEDCTTNFDLHRNRIYNLTLSLSDESAALASSWKVERGTTLDSREIKLNKQKVSIMQYDSTFLKVICSPSDFDYDIVGGEGFTEANLTCRITPNNMIILKSGTIYKRSVTCRVWVRSWDRRKSAYCDVTVSKKDPSLLTPVKVCVFPKDTVLHVGDTLRPNGCVIYSSGDTIFDNSLMEWFSFYPNKVLDKVDRSNTFRAEQCGVASAYGSLKFNLDMMDSTIVTVIP